MMRFLFAASIGCGMFCVACGDDKPVEEPRPLPLDTPASVEAATTTTTARVSWQAVTHAGSYSVYLKDAAGTVTDHTAERTEILFDGFKPEQTYSVCVAALPDEGDVGFVASAYSAWKTFTTSAEPPVPLAVPVGLEVTSVGNEAVAVWTAVEHAAGYAVQMRGAEGAVEDLHATDPTVRFMDLSTDIDYAVRVRTLAPEGGRMLDSPWSEWAEFVAESDVAPAFDGGKGTEDDPYQIRTTGQLLLMAQRINTQDEAYVKASYALTSDIDLSDIEWVPAGTGRGNESLNMPDKNCFRGTFDGGHHRITGLQVSVTCTDDVAIAGLFGIVRGARIRNLALEAIVAADCTAPGSYAIAGGLCGINAGSVVTDCSFSGSVSAYSSSDPLVCSYAGGMTGMITWLGSYENCTVAIRSGQTLSACGAVAAAGALAAVGDSGSANGSNVTVEGDILCRSGDGVPGDALTVGVYAGGLIGNSFGVSVERSTVEVSGTIRADGTGCPIARVAAGGLEGVNAADMSDMSRLTISGRIEAVGENDVYAAGAIASQTNAGYGSVLMSVTLAQSGSISAVTTGDAAYVGGVQGCVSYQGVGITGRCSADIAGTLVAHAKTYAMCGGVVGQSSEMLCCYALLHETSEVTVTTCGGQGASFGGVNGSATSGKLTSCFALVDGRVTLSSEGAPVNFGGVSGVVAATIASRPKSLNGCYALVGGSVTAEGTPAATNLGGVVGMMSGRYGKLNGCWWWAEQTPADGVGMGNDTAEKFAGRDRESMEAARESLNAYAGEFPFFWSDAFGCLMLTNAGGYAF